MCVPFPATPDVPHNSPHDSILCNSLFLFSTPYITTFPILHVLNCCQLWFTVIKTAVQQQRQQQQQYKQQRQFGLQDSFSPNASWLGGSHFSQQPLLAAASYAVTLAMPAREAPHNTACLKAKGASSRRCNICPIGRLDRSRWLVLTASFRHERIAR